MFKMPIKPEPVLDRHDCGQAFMHVLFTQALEGCAVVDAEKLSHKLIADLTQGEGT